MSDAADVRVATRECLHCKTVFTLNRPDKVFCSRDCKVKAKDKRLKNHARRKYPYRIHKKDVCELCGFKPVHRCQLDVDHIDGNHKNDAPGNLQTLCANCHRLKTFLNRDGPYKGVTL